MSVQVAGVLVQAQWFLKQSAQVYQKQDALRKFGGTAAGPGRVDDFRLARNLMVSVLQIALPDNSPTSIPITWGTDKVTWLGWDANTDSSMQRNIATAVAIGAQFDRKKRFSPASPSRTWPRWRSPRRPSSRRRGPQRFSARSTPARPNMAPRFTKSIASNVM